MGDVMVRGADILGDGVNVAARLQALADPGSICLSGEAHQYARKVLPLAYQDLGHQTVRNIEEPIRAFKIAHLGGEESWPSSSEPKWTKLPLPNKPSIAVLPFSNISGDPEQEYFVDGIVEELISALSRVRSFFVIARNSSFNYKGGAVDVRAVGRELGVRYLLEGSVRKSGNRIRLTAQLLDASEGSHLWADRYDGELTDIFDLQDRITERIVGAIEPSIRSSEIERARRKRPDSLDAYDFVMRALPTVWSNEPDGASQGLSLLEQAIKLDPTYPLALALASWCLAQQVIYLRSRDLASDREKALELARQAARLDSDDPLVLTALSAAYMLVRELDLAAPFLEKALLIDPNSAWAWQRSGWLHTYRSRSETAIEHFERSLRLSPLDPINFNSYFGIGTAHANAGRYEVAVTWIEKGLRERPDAVWGYRILASAYANAGRLKEASEAVTTLLETYPNLTISQLLELLPANPDFTSRYAEGLRLAGLPE